MSPQWENNVPIYRQLRDRVVAMILDGELKEGDPLQSVRKVATDYLLNPLTVLKAYQQLVDEGLVEKRRGRGMYVKDGARDALMKDERQRFLEDEWPRVYATIARLGMTVQELLRKPPPPPPSPGPGLSPGATSQPESGLSDGEAVADLDDDDDSNH